MRLLTRLCSLILLTTLATGCSLVLPEVATMPVVHNPFPQLSRVAVLPFFNLSDEPTVNGRQFALAYFAELQAVPGFEVIPLGVVEEAILENNINTADPEEVRRLGNILGADAVVVGAVTDYTPYYPPRCGMRVEWYATNPGFHEIPAGYGLPWGTRQEEYIPQDIVFEAEMALAREQMKTQSPDCSKIGEPAYMLPIDAQPMYPPSVMPSDEDLPVPPLPKPPTRLDSTPGGTSKSGAPPVDIRSRFTSTPPTAAEPDTDALPAETKDQQPADFDLPAEESHGSQDADVSPTYEAPAESNPGDETVWRPRKQSTYKVAVHEAQAPPASDAIATASAIAPGMENNFGGGLPPDWPDPHGFIPPGPSPVRPPCINNPGPVMTHTRIFLGNDPEFTSALAAYVEFRDDARFGGWRSYLERSEDFIRFCCHLHISEMLSARGGATETRVVRHWSNSR
ncbi:hypothetical protein NG895_24865 [Aeoliella sp. ICT_H6.2]|uniref:Uncharacterized protein n=1 Tax=Aeoliella straminimaris TaxID=2954799 RepID=A0A9X2JJT3_9BACT|nr:hypothetical protein [Aeoliella straminimaris]MCO6047143.1 hypothetical protein [Aeoliella straminimaris]